MKYRVIIRGEEAGASVLRSGPSAIAALIGVLTEIRERQGMVVELGGKSLESLVITVDPVEVLVVTSDMKPERAGSPSHVGRAAA